MQLAMRNATQLGGTEPGMEDVSETFRIATQNGVISIARDGVTNAKRCIVPDNALQVVNEKVIPNRRRCAVGAFNIGGAC